MKSVFLDAYGHRVPSNAPALSAGAVSTTAVGTIAPTTGAGAAPTITAVTADDNRGTFTLNPVTGGGAQAAGENVVVTFANPFGAPPRAIQIQCLNITTPAAPTSQAAYATSVTANGFKITTALLVTANNYQIAYDVIP